MAATVCFLFLVELNLLIFFHTNPKEKQHFCKSPENGERPAPFRIKYNPPDCTTQNQSLLPHTFISSLTLHKRMLGKKNEKKKKTRTVPVIIRLQIIKFIL